MTKTQDTMLLGWILHQEELVWNFSVKHEASDVYCIDYPYSISDGKIVVPTFEMVAR